MFEIFVYSTRFEGVHLRGGRVAPRRPALVATPEDFRTEVLGLVKAQMVKNTVIVPVGSKGGFVLKKAPPIVGPRGLACRGGRGLLPELPARAARHHRQPRRRRSSPPPDVKSPRRRRSLPRRRRGQGHGDVLRLRQRHQRQYGFWLGDAFASGGSVGYDHKAMGITARGAGVGQAPLPRDGRGHAVDRLHRRGHRRHVGRRVRQRHAAVAAHPARRRVRPPPHLPRSRPGRRTSFAERERMFACRARRGPTTTRADLGRRRHPARSAKSIALTPEVKAALGIDAGVDAMTPTELVNAILKAPVDLLYNGGIGTYVKAATETHAAGRRPRQRRAARRRPRPALQGLRRRRQPRLHAARASSSRAPAGASTPTRSTTRPASTPPTTRSTSRSLLGIPIADGDDLKQRNALLADDDRRGRRAGAARQRVPDPGAVGHQPHRAHCLDAQARFMRWCATSRRRCSSGSPS